MRWSFCCVLLIFFAGSCTSIKIRKTIEVLEAQQSRNKDNIDFYFYGIEQFIQYKRMKEGILYYDSLLERNPNNPLPAFSKEYLKLISNPSDYDGLKIEDIDTIKPDSLESLILTALRNYISYLKARETEKGKKKLIKALVNMEKSIKMRPDFPSLYFLSFSFCSKEEPYWFQDYQVHLMERLERHGKTESNLKEMTEWKSDSIAAAKKIVGFAYSAWCKKESPPNEKEIKNLQKIFMNLREEDQNNLLEIYISGVAKDVHMKSLFDRRETYDALEQLCGRFVPIVKTYDDESKTLQEALKQKSGFMGQVTFKEIPGLAITAWHPSFSLFAEDRIGKFILNRIINERFKLKWDADKVAIQKSELFKIVNPSNGNDIHKIDNKELAKMERIGMTLMRYERPEEHDVLAVSLYPRKIPKVLIFKKANIVWIWGGNRYYIGEYNNNPWYVVEDVSWNVVVD